MNTFVTLDGLTGSGKTAVGLMLAEALNYFYFEPKALFAHLVPILVDTNGLIKDANRIIERLASLRIEIVQANKRTNRFLKRREAGYEPFIMHFIKYVRPQPYQMVTNEGTISAKIQAAEDEYWGFLFGKDRTFSHFVSNPTIYTVLTESIKQLTAPCGVIMAGDEASPSLIPEAQNKFVLTADLRTRNSRIVDRGRERGAIWDKSEIMPYTKSRDENDMNRPAHLQFPKDATLINTENKTVYEVAKIINPALELKKPISSKYDWQF